MTIVQTMRTALVATAVAAGVLLAACGDRSARDQIAPVASTSDTCVGQTAESLRMHIAQVQDRVKLAALSGDASVARGALRELRRDVARLEDC